MMRTVYLYGPLAEEFGREFRLDVTTPVEAVRALTVNLGKKFGTMIRAGEWHVVAGDSFDEGDDLGVSDEMLTFGLGRNDLHIAPAMRGSKGGGIFQAVLGVAIMAAAFWLAPPVVGAAGPTMGMGTNLVGGFTYGNLAAFGGAMAFGGVAGMLTPTPQLGNYSARESAEERPSYLFTGPKNTTEQGGPVPVIIGKHQVGWTLVSSGITVEQIAEDA
ncbi:tail assembly protein [Pseudodesulfovibrio sp. JC047]|uniref:tail assembly protein n=1 Tax=Pseudodesulfovibrio sp. JC047 TaxID=2683199 RepID=UPI0013D57D39|nr:tail assembly protein [Pseudodesulfovibrio sp. JC047]NDV20819.1 tail assembly protein [Pseudodesulfovibrio sp. JC047]